MDIFFCWLITVQDLNVNISIQFYTSLLWLFRIVIIYRDYLEIKRKLVMPFFSSFDTWIQRQAFINFILNVWDVIAEASIVTYYCIGCNIQMLCVICDITTVLSCCLWYDIYIVLYNFSLFSVMLRYCIVHKRILILYWKKPILYLC